MEQRYFNEHRNLHDLMRINKGELTCELTEGIELLSYIYRSAKFDAKFFNFFARLFILFYFRFEKFHTSVNGKIK